MPIRQAPTGGHAGVQGLQGAGDGEQARPAASRTSTVRRSRLSCGCSQKTATEVSTAVTGVPPVGEGQGRHRVDHQVAQDAAAEGRDEADEGHPEQVEALGDAAEAPDAAKTATPIRSATSRLSPPVTMANRQCFIAS